MVYTYDADTDVLYVLLVDETDPAIDRTEEIGPQPSRRDLRRRRKCRGGRVPLPALTWGRRGAREGSLRDRPPDPVQLRRLTWPRGITSASTATHPSGPQITGFASSASRCSPRSCASHESGTITPTSASTSVGGCPRTPSSSGRTSAGRRAPSPAPRQAAGARGAGRSAPRRARRPPRRGRAVRTADRARSRGASRRLPVPSRRRALPDRAVRKDRRTRLRRANRRQAQASLRRRRTCGGCSGAAVFSATGKPIRSAAANESSSVARAFGPRDRNPVRPRAARAHRARRTARRRRDARAIAREPLRSRATNRPTGGRARSSRYANRCRNAARPVSVPSSTGMPASVEQLHVAAVDAAREVREHRVRLSGLGRTSPSPSRCSPYPAHPRS